MTKILDDLVAYFRVRRRGTSCRSHLQQETITKSVLQSYRMKICSVNQLSLLLFAFLFIVGVSSSNSFSTVDMNMQRPSRYYNDFVKNLPSLQGKTVVITGSSRGLGHITALTVARKGGRLILLNRPSSSQEWYQQLCDEATGPTPIKIDCDLLSFDSVRRACQEVRDATAEHGGIDVLCCNAGIMLADDEASVDGYDITASTNMLSHFLITKELYGSLEMASKKNEMARIVIMSSASGFGTPAFNPAFYHRQGGSLGGPDASYERYHQSKLSNLIFCCELQKRLASSKSRVQAVACHPGVCGTDMFIHATTVMGGKPSPRSMVPSVEDGSLSQLKCIFDPAVQSGDLWGPDRDGKLQKIPMEPPQILVTERAKEELWQVCEDAVGHFELL